ncbi:MAG: hypothetical protein ACKOKB_05205, partial [Bacteroidota bacterium]
VYAPYAGILMGSGTGSTAINGCLWSGTQVVINSGVTTNYVPYVNCQIPIANAGPDKVLNCTTTSTTLNGSSNIAGSTFSWVATNGGNIVSGANTATPVVNAAGTYTLTVTTGTACSSTDVTVVTSNTTAPNANAGVDKVLTCSTTSLILNGSSTTAGVTYSWNGPGVVSGGNTATPTVNAAGTYTLTVTNPANGCTATDQAVVTTNLTVPNAEAGPNAQLTCAMTTATLSGSSTTSGVSYSWTGPGFVSGANTATPLVNTAGTYTLTVTSNSNGCTATDIVLVTLNVKVPIANAGSDNSLTCTTTSLSLQGTSSVSPSNFSWSGPGIVSGANTATPTVNAAGTYSVTVTDPSNGCTSSDDVLITLNVVSPGADAGADNTITCTNGTVSLHGSSATAGVNYSWSGPGISGSSNTASINVNAAGTYTLTVTNPANGCTASDVAVVGTNFNTPSAEAGPANALTCVILEVALSGSSSTSGAQFAWSGPGLGAGSNTATPTINAIGTYFLTVTDPANGCTATDSVVVEEGPCIVPYYKPCPGGKDETKLGCELTSLYENYLLVGQDTIQQIFFTSPDSVYIEIISIDGETQNLFNLIFQTPGYGLSDTIPNGLNPLIITGRFPIANLPNLLNPLVASKINYVRPVYPSITSSGIALTQGDVAQTSNIAREGFQVDGSGVKVCVMSDSYNTVPGNNANTDVVNGDLPGVGNPAGLGTPVQIFKEFPYGQRTDEGRAMLQLIHDVAPGAELAFRTATVSEGDQALGVIQLAQGGCDVIADDVTWITSPFYKDGVIATAVDSVNAMGVAYFSAAGNFGSKSYESTFNPMAAPLGLAGQAHDFGGGDNLLSVNLPAGTYTIVMQWQDSIYSLGETSTGSLNDFDIYLTNQFGTKYFGFNRNNSGGDPLEVLPFTVPAGQTVTANFSVIRASGNTPAKFKFIVFRGELTFNEYTSGASTIVGQSNANGAITLGAVNFTNTPPFNPAPFNPPVQNFSSRGGTEVNGVVRNKPDLVAPNGGNTTVQL